LRDRALVLFPSGTVPDPPGETFDDVLWGAVALGSTCHADAMDEKGDESETRRED